MILGGLAIYIFKKSACCTRLTNPQRPLVDFILPCVHLFRNISLPSELYPKSQLQYCISFPRLTYIDREDLGYTPHRSTSRSSESTHFRISYPQTAFVEVIIAKMVLWQDTVPLLITNNCADTIWPGIYTTAGTGPGTGGFELAAGANRSLEVGSNWYGRVWGRTNCTSPSDGVLTCTTGSCGQMDCTQASVSHNLITGHRPRLVKSYGLSTTNTTFRATHQPH